MKLKKIAFGDNFKVRFSVVSPFLKRYWKDYPFWIRPFLKGIVRPILFRIRKVLYTVLYHKKYIIVIILSISFLIRLSLIIKFQTYLHPKTWEYEEIANNLLSGKGFLYHHLGGVAYRSFNNPLYSFLCAGIYLVTGHSYLAILLVQALFSVFLALTVFYIARILFNEQKALLSSLLVAFYPPFIYYDVFNLIPLSLDTLIIGLIVLSFLKFKGKLNVWRISLVGGFIGLGVLTRGVIGTLLPFLIIYMAILPRQVDLRDRLKKVLVLSCSTFLIISPWIIRNYIIHKEVFLVSATGETFWRGNNQYATGTSSSKEGVPILDLLPKDFRNKVFSLNEIGQKKFFEKEAWQFIKNNPARSLKLYLNRVYYFWWFSPQSGILYPKLYLNIYKYLYILLLSFSLLGIIWALVSREVIEKEGIWLIIMVLLAISLSQSLFYSEGRHRWLVEPLLFPFFVYALSRLYSLSSKIGLRADSKNRY